MRRRYDGGDEALGLRAAVESDFEMDGGWKMRRVELLWGCLRNELLQPSFHCGQRQRNEDGHLWRRSHGYDHKYNIGAK